MGENESTQDRLSFDGILEASLAERQAAQNAEAQGAAEPVTVDGGTEAVHGEGNPVENSGEGNAVQDAQEVNPTAQAQQNMQNVTQEAPQGVNLAEILNLLTSLKAENEQLKSAAAQMNQVNEEQNAVAEETQLKKLLEPPTLDFSVLEYADSDTKQAAFEEYTKKLAEYSREQAKLDLEGQIAPIMENYKREEEIARENNAISTLAGMRELEGFSDALPQIKALLENHKTLASIEPQERYMLGYFLNRGINASRAQPRSAEQIANEAMQNPEVMRILEAKRAANIEARNAEIPVLEASRGLASSSVNVSEAPRNFDEARRLAMRMAGLK